MQPESAEPNDKPVTENSLPGIPDHVLLGRIAKGSYGEVWLARTALGTFRAVKIIRKTSFKDERPYDREFEGITRFEPVSREHDGLVDVLHVGHDEKNGFFYYVMELADDVTGTFTSGEVPERECAGNNPQTQPDGACRSPANYQPHTLEHDLRSRGRLPMDFVVSIGISLLEALQYLHAKGLVHRDIKPANIVFVGGRPKLADVGLVAAMDDTLTLVGSPGYMPPDCTGTPQADLYGLGKVLYEAATGKSCLDFPDLPTLGGQHGIDPKLAELNQVFLRACANRPEEKYQSAAEMLQDLHRLQKGGSLVRLYARRRMLRRARLAGTVVLGLIATVTATRLIGPRLTGAESESEPEVVFLEEFDGDNLDTNRWVLGRSHWPPSLPPEHLQTAVAFYTVQSNSEMVLKATAQHIDGDTISSGAWIQTRDDLRQYGGCRIELELSGAKCNGFALITVSDKSAPTDFGDSTSAALFRIPSLTEDPRSNESQSINYTRVSIRLFPDYRVAVVYPNPAEADRYEVINLAELPTWHLRILASTFSSSGFSNSQSRLAIRRVTAQSDPDPRVAVGYVVMAPSGMPVPNSKVMNSAGEVVAKTLDNGAFMFHANTWPVRIRVAHEDFQPSSEVSISGDPRQRGPLRVELQKLKFDLGDAVEVIPFTGNRPLIGFQGEDLWGLTVAWEGDKSVASLHRVDIQSKTILGPTAIFPGSSAHLGPFAYCHGRLIAMSVRSDCPSGIYELEPDTRQKRHLAPLETIAGGRIEWPWACAFDGEHIWVLEKDGATPRFGLHALNLQTWKIEQSLSTEDRVRAVAWDPVEREFWIANDSDQVYAVSREKSLVAGRLEPVPGKSFRGRYDSLAFGLNHLWAVDSARKQICKIRIRE